jgi:hypothetical protein
LLFDGLRHRHRRLPVSHGRDALFNCAPTGDIDKRTAVVGSGSERGDLWLQEKIAGNAPSDDFDAAREPVKAHLRL